MATPIPPILTAQTTQGEIFLIIGIFSSPTPIIPHHRCSISNETPGKITVLSNFSNWFCILIFELKSVLVSFLKSKIIKRLISEGYSSVKFKKTKTLIKKVWFN